MKQFHTNRRLWLILSACLFVAFGFVDANGGMSKEPVSLWYAIGSVFTNWHWNSIGETLIPIFVFAVMCAIPAVVLGWVLQAIISVLRERRRKISDVFELRTLP